MAIYNTCIATLDTLGREWKYYVRVRAVSMNSALEKSRSLVESSMGEESHRAAVWGCPHQTGAHVIGKTGRLLAVGRASGENGYSLGREVLVIDGEWSTISDLEPTKHEYVVSRVWDKC